MRTSTLTTAATSDLGTVRHPVARVHRGQRPGQVVVRGPSPAWSGRRPAISASSARARRRRRRPRRPATAQSQPPARDGVGERRGRRGQRGRARGSSSTDDRRRRRTPRPRAAEREGDRPRDRPRGSRTSSPIVAIRAYPAKAKNSRPAACSTPYTPRSECRRRPTAGRVGRRPPARHAATTTARAASTTTTMIRVSRAVRVTPRAVDRGQRDHGGDGDRPLPGRRDGVGGEGQRHRRAARGLADHEAPAGEEPPPRPEPLAAVDVGAARGRVARRPAAPRRSRCSRPRRRRSPSPISSPAPAAAAAGANAANTPAPIIEPSPMTTASVVPSRRARPRACPADLESWMR